MINNKLNRIKEIENLLTTHKRRLHERELQFAKLGINADPIVKIEIEEIKENIAKLEDAIAKIEQSSNDPDKPALKERSVNLFYLILLISIFIVVFGGFWLYTSFKVGNSYNIVNEGIALVVDNKLEEARVKFLEAIDWNPNSSEAYFQLAEVYRKLNHDDEAIVAYQRAVDIMPQNSLYHRRFGNLLINYPEKNSEAQQHLELAIQLNRMDASAYNDLGYLFIQQERWTEARVQLETGLGIDPSQAALYKNLGQVDLYDRRLTEAIEHLETSIKIDKTGVGTDAWFWLAQAYAAQNNVSLACEILYDMQKFFHPEGRTEDMLKQLDCSQSER